MPLTHTPSSHQRWQAGFTLPELLVASALGLVALATFLSFNRFQLFALRNQATQLDVQTTARAIVDLMARELRRAGADPNCVKTFEGIAKGAATELRIQADLDGNGAIDQPDENVTYRFNLEGGTVERIAGGVTDDLVSDVNLTGSVIRYHDGTGAELVPTGSPAELSGGQRTAVRRVRVRLAMDSSAIDPQNPKPLRAQVSTDVDLRNRFFVASTACP